MQVENGIPKPWYKHVYRWGQTNLTEDDPANCDLDFWRKQWKRTGVQGLVISCGGIVAYYPSQYGLQYRAASLGDKDYFGIWAAAAREEGLAVVARMDINRATPQFYNAHPDWFCVDKDGEPYFSQGRYYSCVNSGYYKEYIPAVLTEIIERYAPEGFADNSWKGMNRNRICYCDTCKTLFKNDTGLDLPAAPSWEDPNYPAWIKWSYKARTKNWKLFNETTRRVGGEDCLWMGMLNGNPLEAAEALYDLHEVAALSKAIFSDHQARDLASGFEQNALNGSLLRLASSEDMLVTESMANYVRGARTFRLGANPANETRTWMVSGIAGGLSPWYHHIGGGQNDSRQFDTPVPIMQWHKDNQKYLTDREEVAEIGIVWSQDNADLYGKGDARQKCFYPMRGFTLALSHARIPYLPINVRDIAKYAPRLKTLILPDMAVLPSEQIEAVVKFANAGGNLIVTGRTATLDEQGVPNKDDRLWKLLGIRLTGEAEGEFGQGNESWEHYAAHTYMRLPKARHEIWQGFENTTMVPFGGGLLKCESSGPLAPLASYVSPFPIYPPEFSWIREEQPDTHLIFAGQLPGGGRAVYFAGDIDRCCGRSQLPDHVHLLGNAITWATGDGPIKVTGPGFIDCKVYKKQNNIIVHLINLSGANVAPGYREEVYPVGPIDVAVRFEGLTQAQLRVGSAVVPVRYEDGYAHVAVESIALHEMLVFEGGK